MKRKILIPIRRRVLNRRDRIGSSCVVDPFADSNGPTRHGSGMKLPGQIIYEMHVGTFTPEGTWRAAAKQLAELARIGITVIEMMPIADFPGEFGWGYDGVDLFAPSRLYGTPDDLRAFINHAHSLGLGVILDVVYNHFGPEGNYLRVFSGRLFHRPPRERLGRFAQFRRTELRTGARIFHHQRPLLDRRISFRRFPLRRDAKHSAINRRNTSSARSVARRARAAGERSIILVAENEPQETKLVRPRSEGGDDLDGALERRLASQRDRGLDRPQRSVLHRLPRHARRNSFPRRNTVICFKASLTSGRKRRAERRLSASRREAFVAFHRESRQVANSAAGERVRFQHFARPLSRDDRAASAGPVDADAFSRPGIRRLESVSFISRTCRGDLRRRRFAKDVSNFCANSLPCASEEVQAHSARSGRPATFSRGANSISRSARTNRHLYDLHRDLMRLRREDRAFRRTEIGRSGWRCAGPTAVSCCDISATDRDDRLLVVNSDHAFARACARTAARAAARFEWETLWTSDSPRYGGPGPTRSRQTSVGFCPRSGRRVAPGSTNQPAPLSVNEKATHRMIVEDSLGSAISSSRRSFAR